MDRGLGLARIALGGRDARMLFWSLQKAGGEVRVESRDECLEG